MKFVLKYFFFANFTAAKDEKYFSETVLQSPTTTKIPHLHVHKPKTVVVETVLVIFVKVGVGDPLYVITQGIGN